MSEANTVPCPACGEAMPFDRVVCQGCEPKQIVHGFMTQEEYNREVARDARVKARGEGKGER